mmetsp:Transcript_38839/g.88321  ORF Transcript_38839/g.88321 Transcript_38839/m.88321 type:complete len:206 (+) Transcript_38839:292-909(+)
MAVLLIVPVLTHVGPAVDPREQPFAMHPVPVPLPVELPAVSPLVDTSAVDVIVQEVTLVARAVRPRELSLSGLVSSGVLANILCTIWPDFYTFPVLLVILPLALVSRAVGVVVHAVPVGLVVLPLAFVHVSIDMFKAPMPLRLVVLPLPVVPCTVRPDLYPLTMPVVPHPLASVGGSVLEGVRAFAGHRRAAAGVFDRLSILSVS